ncbi:asparaginase [Swingsia samuiensis]|uniref:Asparaginase n=1 Tax=Swingsia samuiensis TaxID=1293412 RepID=A0A4Y6UHK5_9PROT|nr:asparaginase [Swingsia samuiensis]QDH17053.1 asparaginase [Swingsia samuiensis]
MTTGPHVGLLAEVTRGNRVESRHYGRAVVVDAHGKVVWSCGAVDESVYPRSTVKALLALELVASGAAERLNLSNQALALACASHGGEPQHVEVAQNMLSKVGLGVNALECGAHWPTYEPAARALAAHSQEACAFHNNCSGKHAGLICLACDQGVDIKNYIDPSHEIQRRVTNVLEMMTKTPHGSENRGTDGCSMPTYAVPLTALAHAFARFGTGQSMPEQYAKASEVLREAVAQNPFLVAGSSRYDTIIMNNFKTRAFVKMGAEGVMVASLPELGLGIAIKIDDGANRAAEVAMSSLLSHFGAESLRKTAEDDAVLQKTSAQILKNWRGVTVGEIRPAQWV